MSGRDIVSSTCSEVAAEHAILIKHGEAGVLWGQAARAGKARALHSLIWTGYESSTCDELEQQGISKALRYLWVINVRLAKAQRLIPEGAELAPGKSFALLGASNC